MLSQSFLPFHGGITEHVWHLCAQLHRRGHEVTLLTGAPLRKGHAREPGPPGVRILRLGRTVRLPSHGARACIAFGWGWRSQLRRCMPEPPELVHIHSPLEPGLPLWALRSLPGPKIGTFHTGGRRDHWGYRRFGWWLRTPAAHLARRIAVSREAARFVRRHLPGRYDIVPNGIDLGRFREGTAGRRDPARRPLRLLFVGRLDPRKGVPILLEALAQLRTRSPRRVELDVVGDGPERRALASSARERRLPVTFSGPIPRARLPEHYRRADLLVAPSLHGESFGITLLEGLASGLPIVASDLSGYRETLAGSGAARFASPGSASELCEQLASLAANAAMRRAMGRAGRRYVRRFAWETVAERVERIYRDVRELEAHAPSQAQRFSCSMRTSPRSVRASSTS